MDSELVQDIEVSNTIFNGTLIYYTILNDVMKGAKQWISRECCNVDRSGLQDLYSHLRSQVKQDLFSKMVHSL